MALKLNLRANERIVINGAVLTAVKPTTLLINNHAALLLERQIMRPEAANSPARRIYFAIQGAYMASSEERPDCLARVEHYLGAFEEATSSASVRATIQAIRARIQDGAFYDALKLTNQVIAYEDAVLAYARDVSATPVLTEADAVAEPS